MNLDLESLRHCADADCLKPLVHSICSGFGEVMRLDVLVSSQVGKRRGLCFLRLATLEQEQSLMRALHSQVQIGRFGGDVVLIVDLLPKGISPSKSFALDQSGIDQEPVPLRDFQPTLPMASSMLSPMSRLLHQTNTN